MACTSNHQAYNKGTIKGRGAPLVAAGVVFGDHLGHTEMGASYLIFRSTGQSVSNPHEASLSTLSISSQDRDLLRSRSHGSLRYQCGYRPLAAPAKICDYPKRTEHFFFF